MLFSFIFFTIILNSSSVTIVPSLLIIPICRLSVLHNIFFSNIYCYVYYKAGKLQREMNLAWFSHEEYESNSAPPFIISCFFQAFLFSHYNLLTQKKIRPKLKVKFLSKILDILRYFTDYNNERIIAFSYL